MVLDLYPIEECKNLYKNLKKQITDTQICASGFNGIGPCQGDSGGMLEFFAVKSRFFFF